MNKELIPFDADVLALMGGLQGGPPSLPFGQEIYLLGTYVAGTSYVDDIESIEQEIVSGDLLELRREPGNPYDPMAILVLDPHGRKMGYVPRESNKVLARLMDGGKFLAARVKTKEWRDSFLLVKIRIFLQEP